MVRWRRFGLQNSCNDYLDFKPNGTLTSSDVVSAENVDKLAIAAYAAIGNDFWSGPITSMWIYGSVRSDDSEGPYKYECKILNDGETVKDNMRKNHFLYH